MAAHTERMEKFENTIFKQREEINDRMAEMFGLLKELTTSRAPKKVLIGEEAKSPITKNVNSISLAKGEEERSDKGDMAADGGINGTHREMPLKEVEKETEAVRSREGDECGEKGTKNKQIKELKEKKQQRHPALSPFNDSLSGIRVRKVKGKNYNLLPKGLPDPLFKVEKGIKNDIEPIAPTMTVNRLVLEWEEKIKLHQEKEMKFDQWRSKNFRNKHHALVKIKNRMDDEGDVTKFSHLKTKEEFSTVWERNVEKPILLEDKQISSVEVFSTWMAFGGNTLRGDDVAGIKRRRRDLYGDRIRNLAIASGCGRLKEHLESSTWRQR
ncbi:hypothetical protein Tco_1251411 [Tanacetum coccineum]